jgi:glycosyltransferase involved in cell wall biosynthesis
MLIPARLRRRIAETRPGREMVIARRRRRAAGANPMLRSDGAALRWLIRSSAPPGAEGEVWGDAHFADDLAAALVRAGRSVEVARRGAPHGDADVVVDLRGLYRLPRVEGAVNVLWVISHPDLVDTDELRQYDLAFAAGPAWAERRTGETGIQVRPLLQATAPERFRPDAAAQARRGGALFVGTTRNAFRPAVMWAIEAGSEVELHGHGWEQFLAPEQIRSQHLANADLPGAYAGADIVLNDHWADMAREGFISNRVFDAAAAGAVVVTDYVDGIRDVSPELIRVFSDPSSLRDALAVPSPDAATRAAAAARVASEHSFEARAAVVIEAVDRHLRPERRRGSRSRAEVSAAGADWSEDPRPAPEPSPTPEPLPTPLGAPAAVTSPLDGLHEFSMSLTGLTVEAGSPRLNLVLPELSPHAIFAGVKTALEFARGLGERLGLEIRVFLLKGEATEELRAALPAALASHGVSAEVVFREDLPRARAGSEDLWVATHWWTAHAIDTACGQGLIPREAVVYLVQDYEPGFVGWSTDFAIAHATYAAGFLPVVNSAPLAAYLAEHAPEIGRPAAVFGPSFDLDELRAVARRRRPSAVPRIFFYGRPSKPRNLFGLGVASLREAARRLDGMGVSFTAVMAGEDGPSIDLGPTVLRNAGALSRAAYFDLLAKTDVGLSLQLSPHPSHTPFDLALSGAQAITNEFEGGRATLHPRLLAVPARVDALADALVECVVSRPETSRAEEVVVPELGAPFADAIDAVARGVRDRRGG